MKLLKRLFFICTVATVVYMTTGVKDVTAESGDRCSWKQIDCPGWFNGSYEACLDNGDGNTCNCGATTRPCESSTE